MICQLCLSAEATSRVIERVTRRGFVEHHYCQTCCTAKYLCATCPSVCFPRPTFTLRRALLLVLVFAIFNSLVVLIARSLLIGESPEYINEWRFSAILMVNICLAIAAAHIFVIRWLRKVIWYRRTGALAPIQKPTANYAARRITMMFVAWYLISLVLPAWICTLVLGRLEVNLMVYIPTSALLSLLFLLILSNSSAYRPVIDLYWLQWKRACAIERTGLVLRVFWEYGISVFLLCGPARLFRFRNPWFVFPVLLLFVLGCQVVSIVVEAVSTRGMVGGHSQFLRGHGGNG